MHSQEILRFAQNDNNMLPRPQRLNLKKDFKWVASGKKLETKFLKLFIRTGDSSVGSVCAKVGIALSSRNFKKAVDRNRARRLTSKAFETIYSKLPTNISIVALPKPGVLSVKSEDLVLELEEALRKGLVIPSEERNL